MKRNPRIDHGEIQRAALYIRVSSEEQALHGRSLEAQRDTLMQYVKDNQLRLIELYADEGTTARKRYTGRPGFMRMLSDAQAGRFDVILFIKLDRWFRSVSDYYEVQKILDENNVRWIATEEDYDTTTANGRLHLNIKLSIAQDESDRTAERIKFVFDSKVKRGEVISGKFPLGYKIEDKRLVVDADTAPIAQDIFATYADIKSLNASRKYIMEKYGLIYCFSGLKALLRNERYIGRAHEQDDFCEPLIDGALFARVQQTLTERAQRNIRTPNVYLFTGLVFCAECGRRLSAHLIYDKYVYYRCSYHEKLHSCSHSKRTNEETIEKWLLENLEFQFELYNSEVKLRQSMQAPSVDTAKIKRKMEKLKDLYLNDLIDRTSYERDYIALRDELRTEIIPNHPLPVNIAAAKTALSAYTLLDRAGKKKFWNKILKRITISNTEDFFITPI